MPDEKVHATRKFTVKLTNNTKVTVEGNQLLVKDGSVLIYGPGEVKSGSTDRPSVLVFVAPLDHVYYVYDESSKGEESAHTASY